MMEIFVMTTVFVAFSILNIILLLEDILWYGMQWISVHRPFGSKVGGSSHSPLCVIMVKLLINPVVLKGG